MQPLFARRDADFAAGLSTEHPRRLTRRQFLQATGMAGGGLMLAIALPEGRGLGGRLALAQQAEKSFPYPPAAFIRIGTDDRVTVLINKLEFGQGVLTSMAMLIAEELDCLCGFAHLSTGLCRG